MLRLLAILGVALLGLGLLTGCAAEEEGATATTSPTAAVVTTPAAIPSPGATPTATPKATATPTPTPTATPAAGLGKLAFVRDGDIWLLDVDSGQERQLTSDGGNVGPRWSPDGRWLAFVKAEAGAIWLMREDGSDASLVAESASGSPIWAPGEDRLAYVTSEGVLGLLDVESGEQQELAGPDWEVSRFAWQPDGERLAIERWIEGEELTPPPNTTVDQGIWLLNADGSDLTKLYGLYQRSQLGPVAYLGGWSPDSKRITFWQADIISASLLADGAPLLVLPVEGGEPQEIASFALLEPGFVAWSPQGDRLAVVEGGGRETWVNKQIVVMQPDGSDRRVLSDAGRADLFPAWSPDGQSIAFASGESGYEDHAALLRTRRIWVANADGSDKRQLTDDPAYADQFPQWSADGTHILFVRQQAEAISMEAEMVPVEVWLMKADGSEQRKLIDGLSGGWFGYYGFVDWGQLLDWHR